MICIFHNIFWMIMVRILGPALKLPFWWGKKGAVRSRRPSHVVGVQLWKCENSLDPCEYPLINIHKLWKITIFNGKIHYFYGDMPLLC